MSHRQDRFVCALNRDRDGYQVPLALFERGLLECFVTDFYAGQGQGWFPAALARRHAEGLPASAARNSWSSLLVQSGAQLARLPMGRVFQLSDRLLSVSTGRHAWHRRSPLYCYGGYLPPEPMIRRGTRRVVFEYHPHPGAVAAMLATDAEVYPEVAWSHAHEGDSQGAEGNIQADWRRADAVVCASSMTRRCLEAEGCDPARITVIPYGSSCERPKDTFSGRERDVAGDRCRFLFVGQGVQRKGLHHLVRAWRAAGLDEASLTLVCSRIDPGISAMIPSSGITLLPRQSAADLDALYRQADVFVMPSLVEGFGLVYLEALERGCMVIGTHNTGLPDMPLSDDERILIDAGDLEALADAMTRARDRWRAGRLDRDSVRRAAASWRWEDFRRAVADHAETVLR